MHSTANLSCSACAGNGGCTLICRDFAARLGLVDASGRPRQASVRLTTVRGVVAGASEQIPLMALSYELRGGSPSSAASAQLQHEHAKRPGVGAFIITRVSIACIDDLR